MTLFFLIRAGMAAFLVCTVACSSDGDGKAANSDAGRRGNMAGPDGSSASGGASNTGDGASEATNGHAGADSGGGDAPDADANPSVTDAATSPEDDAQPVVIIDSSACDGPGARFATTVVDHHFGTGQNYGQDLFPAPILGPPQGGGECQGGFDVVSLGNGGDITLAFDGNAIIDGPGPDFLVFENAFGVSCDVTNPYAELATVSVSEDGATWFDFPCTATAYPYGQCSGWHVVYANSVSNAIDPTDPAVAGGDPYDLRDVGLAFVRYVKITDRADLDGDSGVYDLDAVAIVNALCP